MSSKKDKEWDIEDFIKREMKKQLDNLLIKKETKKSFREIEEKNYEEYFETIKDLDLPSLEIETLNLIFKDILEDKKNIINKLDNLSDEKKKILKEITPEILRNISFIYSYLVKGKENE
ncbi:MAG TPA: hypothetical protein PKW55_02550 [Spirochaetota bacterium]|nr:hypothetical protein [Spirochaetota bacterium]HOM38271.1 hypothetical protein [Spirochaetota bacterium]HPQ48511.1 hypothetical protein [Spirochaetota bacterium]